MDESWQPGRIDADRVYDLQHDRGDACPVVDLLYESFGNHDGGYLLWNFTCFPMSDAHAWEQAKALVQADCRSELREHLQRESQAIEDAMQRAVARHW